MKASFDRIAEPQPLEDVLKWWQSILNEIDSVPEQATQLDKTLRQGLVLTECYAGCATVAVAFRDLLEAHLKKIGSTHPVSRYFLMHAATDPSSAAQTVLAAHCGITRPAHRFKNVLGRLPDKLLGECLHIEAEALQKFARFQLKRKFGEIDHNYFEEERRVFAAEYFDALCNKLEWASFKTRDWCLEHEDWCPVTPRASAHGARWHWLEAGGSTCCPYSSLNSTKGTQGTILTQSTLPLLVWLYSCRYYRVHRLMHECLPGFDVDIMRQILCIDLMKVPRMVVDISNEPNRQVMEYRGYSLMTMVVGPSDLGVPARRPRRYTSLKLGNIIDENTDKVAARFRMQAFRTPTSTCSIYLSRPVEADACFIPRGYEERLEGYLLNLATDAETQALLQDADCALVSLNHNAEFTNNSMSVEYVATLTRGSLLYDLKSQRVLSLPEQWCIMGWPHSEIRILSDELRSTFPFESRALGKCSAGKQRELLGNGMHMAVVGTWLAYTLSV